MTDGRSELEILIRAAAFAAHKHRDQRRKDAAATPYINHPLGLAHMQVPTPMRIFLKAAYLDGYPLMLLASMAHYLEEHRRGAFTLRAPNDDVQLVTGRAAESFENVARRLALHPSNRRSTANALREFVRFMSIPFVPMPSLSRYLRGLRIAAPSRPEYTDESPVWQREHGVSHIAVPSPFPRRQPFMESSS